MFFLQNSSIIPPDEHAIILQFFLNASSKTVIVSTVLPEILVVITKVSLETVLGRVYPFTTVTCKFVFDKAQNKYFVFAAVDDLWESTFLEKNIQILDSNDDVVGSISKSKRYGSTVKDFSISSEDSIFLRIYKKTRSYFRKYGSVSIIGSYDERIGLFLRNLSGQSVYGIFRTIYFKQVFPFKPIISWDVIFYLEDVKIW